VSVANRPFPAFAERYFRYAVAAVIVGVLGAAFAILFRLALHEGVKLVVGNPNITAGFAALPIAARIALPAAGGAVAGAIGLFAARQARGHGVAEILEAVALGRGEIRLPTVLLKAVASLAALCTGGSIGREGSIIQFGAGSGSTVGRWLRLPDKERRLLVAAGTGAGFAAAYNTPIAAVLFVVEVVTGVFGLDVLVPVIVATVISTTLTRMALGGGPLYGTREFALVSQEELLAYCALGLAAAVVGAGFIAMLSAAERIVGRWPLPRILRGALGGAAVGVLATRFPQVTGNGYEAIQSILDARVAGAILALLLLAKAGATISSVSSGSPGGVFTPSMFLGAALGGLVGSAVPHLLATRASAAEAGGYALVGMAALIASTTHAPVMAATLGFELSGDYSLVVPLLLSTIIAAKVSRRLRPDSVYTEELRRRGIPWRGSLTERLARAVSARDILTSDPPVVPAAASIETALSALQAPNVRVVYVPGEPLRAIDLHEAKRLWTGETPEHGLTAGEVAHEVQIALPEETLLDLSKKLWASDWGEVPVIEPGPPPHLMGIVTRRTLLGAMDREILQRDVLLTRVVRFEGDAEGVDYLELPAGHRVEEITVPVALQGRALEVGEIHRRWAVTILALRKGDSGIVDAVPPRYIAIPGDHLIVVGLPESIAAFRTGEPQCP
jgi:CIC family chloride channel protein